MKEKLKVKCLDEDIRIYQIPCFGKSFLRTFWDKKKYKTWFALDDLITIYQITTPFCVIIDSLQRYIKKNSWAEDEYLIKDVKIEKNGKEIIEPTRFISFDLLFCFLKDFSNLSINEDFAYSAGLIIDEQEVEYLQGKINYLKQENKTIEQIIQNKKDIIKEKEDEIKNRQENIEKAQKNIDSPFSKSIILESKKEISKKKKEINLLEKQNNELNEMIKYNKKRIKYIKEEQIPKIM